MTTEKININNIKKYDFRSPKKFGKDQQRTIESLYENFARNLVSHISVLTRVVCEISITKIEEIRYFEYSNSIDETNIMAYFDILPLEQSIEEATMMMRFDSNFGFYLIDKLLGGPGTAYDIQRDFTEIELMLFDNIFSQIAKPIQASWSKHLEIDAMLKNIEANPRLVQAMAPEDIVMNVQFTMLIDQMETSFSVCMAAISLEKMMDKFIPKYARANKRTDIDKDELQRVTILESLQDASVELKATLDEIEVDLHDILQLQVGDVIPLSKRYDANVIISADEQPWFEGKIGETKMRKAVKISKLID